MRSLYNPTPTTITSASTNSRPPQGKNIPNALPSQETPPILRKRPSATILTRRPIINRELARPAPAAAGTSITNNTTPLSSTEAAPSAHRKPLKTRDHNVAPPTAGTRMRNLDPKGTQMTSHKTPTIMAYDKHHTTNNNNTSNITTGKPPMPTLARGMSGTRTPITPKIAAPKVASAQQRQTVTVATTPLAQRRGLDRPESALSTHGHAFHTPRKDDLTSPVPAFLTSSNITPRSGARQTRVDSGNTTPNGTPVPDRSDSWDTRPGLASTPSGLDERLRYHAGLHSPGLEGPRQAQSDKDSKFFYASDAKSTTPQPPPSRPISTQPKAPTFFYANGGAIPDKPIVSPPMFGPTLAPPTPTPVPAPEPASSKFVYANGIPDLQVPARANTFSPSVGAPSTTSTSSKTTSRPSSGTSVGGFPTHHTQQPQHARPISPVKLPSFPIPQRANSSLGVSNRSAIASAPQLAPANPVLRRTSTEGPPRREALHTRNKSLTIADPPAVAKILSSNSVGFETSAPSPQSAAVGLASILQTAEDFHEQESDSSASDEDRDSEDKEDKACGDLRSPTKSSHPRDQQLDELVASARRERKVQDLEITNASLEAINRTLERQLRKQQNEIRRYKRLSRSGRLSLASAASSRAASGSTVEGPLANPDLLLALSDLSEEEDGDGDGDGYSDHDHEFPDESDVSGSEGEEEGLSPSTRAMRDARHRKRDERRLQLDLSKHQELLIDSQKINQSIKRCLGWTEELIREGKKALEFQVRVSEVELGGRVLAPPDEEEEEEEEETEDDGERADRAWGDDSSVLTAGTGDTVLVGDQDERYHGGGGGGSGKQDRDSGVEMSRVVGGGGAG